MLNVDGLLSGQIGHLLSFFLIRPIGAERGFSLKPPWTSFAKIDILTTHDQNT
jgi:hypothetical protein